MRNALIIGSNGTIGRALVKHLQQDFSVNELSRENCDFTDESLANHAIRFSAIGRFDIVICCIGVLHDEVVSPEKRITQIDQNRLMQYYRVNAVLPALCLKHFTSLLRPNSSDAELAKFVVLSAMVGSIEDNKLGGWYGYRSSKAALNMLLKTAAIEIARSNKHAVLVAMHPGTTVGPLSQPFAGGVRKSNYYSPNQSARRIIDVVKSLKINSNGRFLNWDGEPIPW